MHSKLEFEKLLTLLSCLEVTFVETIFLEVESTLPLLTRWEGEGGGCFVHFVRVEIHVPDVHSISTMAGDIPSLISGIQPGVTIELVSPQQCTWSGSKCVVGRKNQNSQRSENIITSFGKPRDCDFEGAFRPFVY
jgi:hypothetical protein